MPYFTAKGQYVYIRSTSVNCLKFNRIEATNADNEAFGVVLRSSQVVMVQSL